MFNYFIPRPFRGEMVSTDFKLTKRKLRSAYDTARATYRLQSHFLDNNHFSLRVLEHLNFAREDNPLSPMFQYKLTESKLPNLEAAFGLFSWRNIGEVNSDFFGMNCYSSSVSFGDISKTTDWKTLRPIRVLEHPFTDISPVLPTDIDSCTGEHYTVVGIDLPMLSFMYNSYLDYNAGLPQEEKINRSNFVCRYVIPGMLDEYLDIAIRNMYLAKVGGETLEHGMEFQYRRLILPEREIHDGIDEIILDISLAGRRLTDVMDRVPLVYSDNLTTAIPTVNRLSTKSGYFIGLMTYINWLYVIMKIPDKLDNEPENLSSLFKRNGRKMRSNLPMKEIDNKYLERQLEDKLDYIAAVSKDGK